ncbi:Uncharacterised protein [uncultured archaeon]|nr:Uncharacterised protein [uncultured archaeon]
MKIKIGEVFESITYVAGETHAIVVILDRIRRGRYSTKVLKSWGVDPLRVGSRYTCYSRDLKRKLSKEKALKYILGV